MGNDAGSQASLERPVLILMVDCREVRLRQIELRNSAYWMQCYLACDGVFLSGVTVRNHCNFNNDGIDIDSKNVLVENCEFDSDDDAICLKSHDPDRWCENVVIRNCTVRTNCNGVKLGTGRSGDSGTSASRISVSGRLRPIGFATGSGLWTMSRFRIRCWRALPSRTSTGAFPRI